MKFEIPTSARKRSISSISFSLFLLILSVVQLVMSRAIANSQTIQTQPKTPDVKRAPVQRGFINFGDPPVNLPENVAETEIHFQTDAERNVELQQRHPDSNSDKLLMFPGKTLEQSHTVEPTTDPLGEELDKNSAEALREFLDWLSKNGPPEKIVPTVKAPPARIFQGLYTDFSISFGESLPCKKDGHILTHDGKCREVVGF